MSTPLSIEIKILLFPGVAHQYLCEELNTVCKINNSNCLFGLILTLENITN
jgi:hypothetical protein